jgi:hypothetical protein
MPAVSNTSPIFNLACINRLPLLPEQFGAVWIPKAVDDELGDWVQDGVQVATPEPGSRLVSCAGSTKRLTATNQEVAGSSPAGRANSLIIYNLTSRAKQTERLVRFARKP